MKKRRVSLREVLAAVFDEQPKAKKRTAADHARMKRKVLAELKRRGLRHGRSRP